MHSLHYVDHLTTAEDTAVLLMYDTRNLFLTVLKSDHKTKYVVLEMGMRGLGQIDFLGRIAKPNYGIITN